MVTDLSVTNASGAPDLTARRWAQVQAAVPQEATMKRAIPTIAISGIALAAIWFARVRRRGELPGLVTHRFNPLVMRLGLAGGERSPWAILEHVGRVSGVTYRTPISLISRAGHDQVFVRLTYGTDVHWVKNVRAAGHCRAQLHETILELDEPATVSASSIPFIPPRVAAALDRAGRTYLRLHILELVPGTFTRASLGIAASPTDAPTTGLEIVQPAAGGAPAPVTA